MPNEHIESINRIARQCCDESEARVLHEAAAEINRLQAIVDRLPVTKDGVHAVPGDVELFHPAHQIHVLDRFWQSAGGDWMVQNSRSYEAGARYMAEVVSDCYSTREAAEAAREGQS